MNDKIIKVLFERFNKIVKRIESGDFSKIESLVVPKDRKGIYIIMQEGGDIFYVGSSGKRSLYKRIILNHINGNINVSSLRKKLLKRFLSEEAISNYLNNKCLFLIEPISDFDEILAIEYLLIYYLRKKGKILENNFSKN